MSKTRLNAASSIYVIHSFFPNAYSYVYSLEKCLPVQKKSSDSETPIAVLQEYHYRADMTGYFEASKNKQDTGQDFNEWIGQHEAYVRLDKPQKIKNAEGRQTPTGGPALFVRIDRIGDLILSLPADGQFDIQKDRNEREVDWWIGQGLGFIADHSDPIRRVREMKKKISFHEFKTYLREVKLRQYQLVVILHAPWWVSVLMWLARIPVRAGPRSQWHSFLFFNKGLRQKRSLAEFTEFEYNMRIMDTLSHLPTVKRDPLKLKVDADWKLRTLEKFNLADQKYSVIHPGMGGSARNWPASHYSAWIKEVSKKEAVVITGTAADLPILTPIKAEVGEQDHVIWLNEKLTGPELLHVLDGARCVLAPSTGVVHLAASLGRPTIGIYSPVRVQHPKRWGPQGDSVKVLLPDVDCPGKKACLGQSCPHYDCMEQISIETVRRIWPKIH